MVIGKIQTLLRKGKKTQARNGHQQLPVHDPEQTAILSHNLVSVIPGSHTLHCFPPLAQTYANNHATMSTNNMCDSSAFPGGITNGNAWYPVRGGMQDYNYIYNQCFEITLEVSCCKYPNDSTLQKYWNDNKVSLIEYMKKVHMGVKGQVFDINGKPVQNAIVEVKGKQHICPYKTNKYGEYYLLLLPGTYTFNVSVQNATLLTDITVPETINFSAMICDFQYKVNIGSPSLVSTTCSPNDDSNSSSILKACLLTILLRTALTLFVNVL